MSNVDPYWRECVECALDTVGLIVTDEQIESITRDIEIGQDLYGQAHGYDVIGNPGKIQAEEKLEKLQREVEQKRRWEDSTKPCRACITTGIVLDMWGRDQTCPDCRGEGRVSR